MTHKIALVDDDRNILASVSIVLKQEGFEVVTYEDGSQALHGLMGSPVDLAILDIKMPRMDGIELFQQLQNKAPTPAIFLTSKDDEVDELLGLRIGADDYVKKPFSQQLLIERIKAVIRRIEAKNGTISGASADCITRGQLLLEPAQHLCLWREKPVNLTVTEFLIMQALATRPGHVKSRDQLIDAAYGENIYVDDRTIDSHIKRLRRKFRDVDESFANIETLYGLGYKYREAGT